MIAGGAPAPPVNCEAFPTIDAPVHLEQRIAVSCSPIHCFFRPSRGSDAQSVGVQFALLTPRERGAPRSLGFSRLQTGTKGAPLALLDSWPTFRTRLRPRGWWTEQDFDRSIRNRPLEPQEGKGNPMALIIGSWVVLIVVFTGVGLLGRRAFGLPVHRAEDLLEGFWLGWAAEIAFLQIFQLGFRIGPAAVIIVALAGLAGWLLYLRPLAERVRVGIGAYWSVLVAAGGIAGLVSTEAMRPIQGSDTPAYHLSTVVWLRSFRILPGLGNLEPRLAFNNAYFLYAALLDFGPFHNNSYQLANGLLLMALVLLCLVAIRRVLPGPGKASPADLFLALFLGPALALMNNDRFPSLSPDVGLFPLGVVLCSQVIRFLAAPADRRETNYRVFWISLVASAGMAAKQSFIGLGLASILLTVVVWRIRSRPEVKIFRWRSLAIPLATAAVVLLPWEARTAIVSGYLGYPTTFGPLAVDWRMPLPWVQHEETWIQARARNPDIPPNTVSPSGGWLATWFQKLPNTITAPLQASVLLGVVALATLDLRRRQDRPSALWLILLLPLAALAFWFFTAPAYRFAQASFWILMMVMAVLVAESATGLQEQYRGLLVVVAVLVALWVSPFSHAFLTERHYLLLPPDNSRTPAVTTMKTDSGLLVRVPRNDACWSTPIPCTDEFHSSLELRIPGDLASGFRIHPGAVDNWTVQ